MDQDWEKIQQERDLAKVRKIDKCNNRSSFYLLVGILSALLSFSILYSIMESIVQIADAAGADSVNLTLRDITTEIGSELFVACVLFLLLALYLLFRAMFKWEEAENLAASRFFWNPDEDEIEYINKRFDNDFAQYILSAISPTDTESIEVGFGEVKIISNDGKAVCNYNKCGYSRLSNYGTKQFAYYLASHSFPGGFVIYQAKHSPAGSSRYLGGVTDIGGVRPPKPKTIKRLKAMLNWLAVQLQELLRLKTSFKMPAPESGPSPSNNGQIVINKGYVADKEGLKPL